MDDILERIAKKLADAKPAEFDVLTLEPPEEVRYTGDNSGDNVGNSALDADDDAIVRKVLASLAKKDKNPTPA